MSSRVRAVILDLDDTLFDHHGSSVRAVTAWVASWGVTATTEMEVRWLRAEREHFNAWRDGEISFAEQRRRRLRDFLPTVGRNVDHNGNEDLDAIFSDYLAHYEAAWRAFPDALPTLAALRKLPVPTAVLTNGRTEQQRAKLAAIGATDLVGRLFTSEALGVSKPQRASYLRVCSALDVAPYETVHIGDDHELDVVAPRRAGLRAIHLDRVSGRPSAAGERIASLSELVPLLVEERI